ncbi:MAG: UdgX family uracil-DNA binding protein [Zymomonas mobilis]|uniref:Type-4 uracil-DNA glycosylase n=1 Tax=Zymomonas mobilis TaxID=542 RepID=A0A542W1P6_ZYMMB|nr:UdgX family uracil-DNA binding protein [Zymomonas mobilis]TQL17496.1 DNA polymerase [Zymomonas mobilis]
MSDSSPAPSWEQITDSLHHCTRCSLYKNATQVVCGEGSHHSPVIFVGEQPGDQEDLAGRPFVGPAGKVFDEVMASIGWPREEIYLTNAVKHFKFYLQGQRRIHQTPAPEEVECCRIWLRHEWRLLKPRLTVALGATAVLALTGKKQTLGALRGRIHKLKETAPFVATYHPSYILRQPNEEGRQKAYQAMQQDLTMAREFLKAAS